MTEARGYLRPAEADDGHPCPAPVSCLDVVRAGTVCRGRISTPPVEAVPELAPDGVDLRLQLECFQPTGSFKVRGALAAAARHRQAGGPMVTASAGNHALGLAEAANRAGLPARIFVPASADPVKLARLRAYPAPVEVVAVEGSYDDTEHAARLEAERADGAVFVSSYNDPDVVAGQGTVALDLLEAWPDVEAVVVPVGGGGLIAGIGVVLSALAPGVRVVGVEPARSPAMATALSVGDGARIAPGSASLAEGLVGNLDAGSITVPLARRHVDEIVLVGEHELAAATAALYHRAGLVVEPSAAAALAGIPHARALRGLSRVACVITGRNVSGARHAEIVARAERSDGRTEAGSPRLARRPRPKSRLVEGI